MSRDYFELLGLPAHLNISQEDLQRRFYDLSRQWHPDRFARKSEEQRQAALDTSSDLNDAYRTLREPVRRAEYVLKQQGFDVGEQGTKDVPPELLEEVFELNMAMEELRGGDESARAQLDQAAKKFHDMLTGIDTELEKLFINYDAQPGRESLQPIRNLLNRRKYIQNLAAQVSAVAVP